MKKIIILLLVMLTPIVANNNLQELSNNIVKKISKDTGPTTIFFTKKSFRDSVTGNILKVSSYLKDELEVSLTNQKYILKDDLGEAKYILSVSFSQQKNSLDVFVKYRSTEEMDAKTIKESIEVSKIPKDSLETTDKIITKSDREKILKNLDKTSKQNVEIKKGISDISKNITKIGKAGGIIADPSTPEEYYSNARTYELKGDFVNARKAYLKYFSFKQEYIDPHINYSNLLRVQEGRSGAKEVYEGISAMYPTISSKVTVALLGDKDKVKNLKKLLTEYPDYSPILYYLSKEFSQSKAGEQTLGEKRLEKEYLEKFLDAVKDGNFLKYYVDKNIAAKQVEDAKRRLQIIQRFIEANGDILSNPIDIFAVTDLDEDKKLISFRFHLLESAKKVGYSNKENGPFMPLTSTTSSVMTSKGTTRYYDGELQINNKNIQIYIVYIDKKGIGNGPFKVFDFYPKACFEGDIPRCLDVGLIYYNLGEARNAQKYWKEACDKKNATACYNLGYTYQFDKTDANISKAKKLYKKACDIGYSNACKALKELSKQDNIKKICESGGGKECFLIAKKQQKDKLAFKFFTKSCENKYGEGCIELASMYSIGKFIDRDEKKAAVLYEKSCELGSGKGCYEAGKSMYWNMKEKNHYSKAMKLYQKACDLDSGDGCYELAVFYDEGKHTDKDKAKAKMLYKKACDKGSFFACAKTGKI